MVLVAVHLHNAYKEQVFANYMTSSRTMSTLVVSFFTSSDAYKTDVNIANECLELISSCDGFVE
jgi:hypothetical protein